MERVVPSEMLSCTLGCNQRSPSSVAFLLVCLLWPLTPDIIRANLSTQLDSLSLWDHSVLPANPLGWLQIPTISTCRWLWTRKKTCFQHTKRDEMLLCNTLICHLREEVIELRWVQRSGWHGHMNKNYFPPSFISLHTNAGYINNWRHADF